MRYFYIIIFLLVFPFAMYGQWEKAQNLVEPYRSNFWLDVQFLKNDPDYGWVCGYNGLVVSTTDGGNTWRGVKITNADQLESIHFVNRNVGYTSGMTGGQGHIFKSIDGGLTWRNVTPQTASSLWGCFFIDENIGLVIGGGCGDEQKFFRTTDGANTWSVYTRNYPNSGLTDAMLYTANGLGYASSSGRIWQTLNGGVTWDIFSVTGNNDWQEEITNIGNSFLVPYDEGCQGSSGRGGMRFSTDNGISWRDFNSGVPMYGSFLHDELRGWACGWGESLFYTSDGGVTWDIINCGLDNGAHLDDIWFINDTLGWVVGDGIYKYVPLNIYEPTIQANQTVICFGDSVELNPTQDYPNYLWSTGETTRTIYVKNPGFYTLIVYSNKCDSAISNTIYVDVLPSPNFSIQHSGSLVLCEGESTFLSVADNFSDYQWSTGESTYEIEVFEEGMYYVEVTNSFGCSNVDSIYIRVVPLPEPVITTSDSYMLCDGETVLLEATDGYYLYDWYNAETGEIIKSSSENFLSVDSSITVFVRAFTQENCFGNSEIEVVNITYVENIFQFFANSHNYHSLDSIGFTQLNCNRIEIKNLSENDVLLNEIRLSLNLAFSIPQAQFPILIEANGSHLLEICFSPLKLGNQYDTLSVDDFCVNHKIILTGFGLQTAYSTESKCDVNIIFTSKSLDLKSYYYYSAPYPNPVASTVNLDIEIVSKVQNFEYPIVELYNSLGQNLGYFKIGQSTMNYENGNYFQTCSFVSDLSNQSSGNYFVIIKVGKDRKTFPIIINK